MAHLRTAAAAAVLALSAGPSTASTVTLDYVGPGPFGTPNLSEVVRIDGPGRGPVNVQAGPFRMTDGVDEFVLWCFDIAQNVADHVTYTHVTNPLGAQRASLLNRLFSSHYSDVDTGREGAAFQVAIWEIVYENLAGALDVWSGDFAASNNDQVLDLANTWLSQLGTDETYTMSFFESQSNQDLLTATPVPLPAGVLLLGTGLGALVIARRRRQTA